MPRIAVASHHAGCTPMQRTPNCSDRSFDLRLLHIPKTAGTSLVREVPQWLGRGLPLLSSEGCLPELISRPLRPSSELVVMTLFRRPTDHVVSLYMHCKYFGRALPQVREAVKPTEGFPYGTDDASGAAAWLVAALHAQHGSAGPLFGCYDPWNMQSRKLTCTQCFGKADGDCPHPPRQVSSRRQALTRQPISSSQHISARQHASSLGNGHRRGVGRGVGGLHASGRARAHAGAHSGGRGSVRAGRVAGRKAGQVVNATNQRKRFLGLDLAEAARTTQEASQAIEEESVLDTLADKLGRGAADKLGRGAADKLGRRTAERIRRGVERGFEDENGWARAEVEAERAIPATLSVTSKRQVERQVERQSEKQVDTRVESPMKTDLFNELHDEAVRGTATRWLSSSAPQWSREPSVSSVMHALERVDVVGFVEMYTASLCVLQFHVTGFISAERCDCRGARAPRLANASSNTLSNASDTPGDASADPSTLSHAQAHSDAPTRTLARWRSREPSFSRADTHAWRPVHVRHDDIGRIPHLAFSSLEAHAQSAARNLTRVDSILYEAARATFVSRAREIERRTGVPLLCDV